MTELQQQNLYKWEPYDGRGGKIDGLFLATPAEIAAAEGKWWHLGSALGKHSKVEGDFELDDITLVSEDPVLITSLRVAFKLGTRYNNTLCGYNPLEYIYARCEACDDLMEECELKNGLCIGCEEE